MQKDSSNPPSSPKIIVFYDGDCPRCRQDRCDYEQLDPHPAEGIEWYNISGRDDELIALGIDPYKALTELHIQDSDGQILSEIPAYQVLLKRIPRYRWLSWLIGLPLIRPCLSWLYRWSVKRRLAQR